MTPRAGKRLGLLVTCVLGTVLFATLGAWQVQRLAWKRDLISRVNTRVASRPVAPPAPAQWPALSPREIEYRRIVVRGVYLHEYETLVDALTERGAGHWVMTPLRTDGGIILVNRGFVPSGHPGGHRPAGTAGQEMEVTGLLRPTEPDGRLLRANRPHERRWFSRDVQAIARSHRLGPVAPFFIDADLVTSPGDQGPVGGMTVIRFRNAHLVYAVTWFGLAGLCAAGIVLSCREKPG